MAWNYRILEYGEDEGFALHEVYYDETGIPNGWTEKPVWFACFAEEGPEGVAKSLEMALADARKHPVLKVLGDKLVPVSDKPPPP